MSGKVETGSGPANAAKAAGRKKAGGGGNSGKPRTNYKFSPQKREKFLAELREGVGRCAAARGVGLDPHTPRDYAKKHLEFASAIEEAELEAVEEVEDALFQAAVSGNVTAIIFWLANRAPKRWKDVKHQEVSGPEGGPIEHRDLSGYSDEDLAAIAAGKRPR